MTYYNNSIPQPGDARQQSQYQIKSNFQSIFTVFANNHAALNTDFQGMHNVLTMRPQNSDPSTAADQIALYNKLDSNSIPELFFRPQSNATPIQLTYPSLQTDLQSKNPNVYYQQQYTFAAGPFVIYGGKITNASNGQTVTLTPTSTLIYVGLVIANYKFTSSGIPNFVVSAVPGNISGSAFKIMTGTIPPAAGITFDVYYIAIGK